MKKNFLLLPIFIITLLLILFLANSVLATTLPSYVKFEASPTGIAKMIGAIITAILGIVGGFALLMFVYGGVYIITSGGVGEKIRKGKEILIWATIGLLIIISSYMIMDFIIKGLKGQLTPAPLTPATSPTNTNSTTPPDTTSTTSPTPSSN